MTMADGIARQIRDDGYAVVPGLMSQEAVTTAKAELGALLDDARWGSGFDGSRTKRAWAPLAVTRCLDQAALAPFVLDAVEQAIGPGAQFGNTVAIQVHPGQQAQVLHYEQGIYPLPRDRDVMITALWALDDFTTANGATRIVPGSHLRPDGKPDAADAVPVEMPAGSVLLFSGRIYHGAGANTDTRPRLGVVVDYIQPWLRPCEAHTLSASHTEARQLPKRLQELLGFNQPTPYLGFINGRHPRDWLMNHEPHDSVPGRLRPPGRAPPSRGRAAPSWSHSWRDRSRQPTSAAGADDPIRPGSCRSGSYESVRRSLHAAALRPSALPAAPRQNREQLSYLRGIGSAWLALTRPVS
jgi:Phytanoyl-CoA dioxygenase (PhyH)